MSILSLSLSLISFSFILSLSLSILSLIYLEAGSSLGFSPKFPQRNLNLNSGILFNTNVNIYKEQKLT